MKILLIGECYSPNLGDGIICETTEKIIHSKIPEAEIHYADMSGRKNFLSEERYLTRGKDNFIKNILKKIIKINHISNLPIFTWKNKQYIYNISSSNFDVAIFAGGNLFRDTFIPTIEKYIYYLSKNNVPIVFNAVGVSEINNSVNKKKLIDLLKNKNIVDISTRDNIKLLNDVYLKDNKLKAVQTSDPGILSQDIYEISKKDSNVIGLGIMKVPNISDEKLEKFWINIIQELDNRSLSWELFCNGHREDYLLAQKIINKLNKDEGFLAKRPRYPNELVEIISNYRGVISYRLHSHIIAYSLDIPSVGIIWDNKLNFFFESINCPDRLLNINSRSNEIVQIMLDSVNISFDNQIKSKWKKKSVDILINSLNKSIARLRRS